MTILCISVIFVMESIPQSLKFGRPEKGTKFEKIFHLQFDVTQILSGRFFQILCLSQKVQTLKARCFAKKQHDLKEVLWLYKIKLDKNEPS